MGVNNNTMGHFSHPGHQLVKLQSTTEFLCDGCKTNGSGTKYRCHPCDFDLHGYCAKCPRSLSTFMHPHPLNLVQRSANATVQRTCDVCRDNIGGLFYRCKDCDFDVHPVCTQLPQRASHNYHTVHPLMLQGAPDGRFCGVCAGQCGASLRYRCAPCNFDIHPQCIVLGMVSQTRNTTPQFVPGPTWNNSVPPPPYGGIPYGAPPGVGSSSGNPYYYMYNHMNQDPNYVYNFMNQQDPNQVQEGGTMTRSGNISSMFAVVGKLVGAFSGTDFSSFM